MIQKFKLVSLRQNLVPTPISYMQNSMMIFTFSIFDRKYPFGQIYSKKSELSLYAETWYLDYFEYAELNDDVHFFYFPLEILFLAKFDPKTQNCRFKLKFDTYQ